MRIPNHEPGQSDYRSALARDHGRSDGARQGSVTLVGAGPGDPELLTLRAVRALQSADVILFDDLVSPEVLDFARREAKKMLVGKTGHGPSCKQYEINALMVGLAKAGRRVVRLKGGDPMIFGRAGEEIAACRNAGIAVEMVPGITAARARPCTPPPAFETAGSQPARPSDEANRDSQGAFRASTWSAICARVPTQMSYAPSPSR